MKRYLLIPALATVILTSCNKSIDLGAPQDATKAEFFINDVNNISDEACNTGDVATIKSLNGIMSGCATVTLDTIAMPHTATIDFGATNCLCTDGRYRRGVINVSFTGRYRDAGTTITVTPSNYYVNDNHVEGVHTVVNQGLNGSGNIYYTIDVTATITLASGGGVVSWTAHRVREWIAGSGTLTFADDIYSITGDGTGTSAGGVAVSFNITAPLVRKLEPGCRMHFVSGTIEITPGSLPTRILDFGNGDCDNIATVTVNGETHTITLWG